jgi:hypothetical protein
MITFESMTSIAITTSSIGSGDVMGQQIGKMIVGLSPTYGVTASDMDIESIIINFTWSD